MKNINPSVKAIVILCCGLLISFHYSVFCNVVLIVTCLALMLLSGVKIRRICTVLLPATLAAASIFMAMAFHGSKEASDMVQDSRNFLVVSVGAGTLYDACALGLRIYAYAALGMLFTFTTEPNAFLYSLMQQCRLAPKFAYGVLAAYNLLPMIVREYGQIRLAYEVRGLHLYPWSLKPLFPALINAMHWAENTAMAMQSKGFDENGKRTWYMKLSVKYYDLIWGGVFLLLSIMGYIL